MYGPRVFYDMSWIKHILFWKTQVGIVKHLTVTQGLKYIMWRLIGKSPKNV